MRVRAILAVALLIAAAPASAQSVKAGIEAWQRGDYEEAVSMWRPLARQGNADAAFNLGQAYRLGRGVQVNLAEAQGWLERAARKDHRDAQTTLGLLLFQNGNRTAGLRWLRQAADGGDARAQLVYGTALFNGDGVPRDPALAHVYVKRAADQGLAAAKSTLDELDEMLTPEEKSRAVALAAGTKGPSPAAPKAKLPAKSAAAGESPARRAAASPPTAPRATAKAGGRWRIQLGAFSKRASAEALFKRLSGSGALAGKSQFLVAAGALTRLQVGPFDSQAAAASACKALSAKGQACFPVAPN